MATDFLERIRKLPCRGLGVSTGYGPFGHEGTLDPDQLLAVDPPPARQRSASGGDGMEATMNTRPRLLARSPSSGEREGVLVDGRHEDSCLETLSADPGRVLAAVAEPTGFPDFAADGIVPVLT